MLEPILSPKIEAYITVLDKIRTLKLSRGLYNAQYTREVNAEIDRIRARLMASAKRAKTAEGFRKLCEEKPEFAKRWKILSLRKRYFDAQRRANRAYNELAQQEQP